MTRAEYEAKRNELMNEAKNLLQEGKTQEATEKMDEVKALDSDYQASATAQANLNALNAVPQAAKAPVQVAPVQAEAGNVSEGEATDSMEYRKAFMNYVLHGERMPQNLGAGVTSTVEGGAAVPQTIVDRIIEKVFASGMILPRVTQTSYKGGVSIPVSLVKPVAEWVKEGSVETNKTKLSVKSSDMIVFSYYKLKVKIAITLEMDSMAIPAFEAMIVKNVSEAMTIGLEQAIISGTGNGQPKGILTETPADGQAIETAKAGEFSYKDLVKTEAALPIEYEAGSVWTMSKKTFMGFVGMTDSNGQPIARVNYGIGGAPERTLLGRTVVITNYVGSDSGVVAFIFNYADYILNSNLTVTVKTYEDNDTDDKVTKAIVLVDGKVVDKGSLVTLSIKASS